MSLPGGAAGADAVERLRTRRAFEAALPPLADVRRHPLRCGYLFEIWCWVLGWGGLGNLRLSPLILDLTGSMPLYCQGAQALESAMAQCVLQMAGGACTFPSCGPAAIQRGGARQNDTRQLCAGSRQRLQAAWEAAEREERAAALERRGEAQLAAAQAALARRLLAVRARDAICVLRHAVPLRCSAACPRYGARYAMRSSYTFFLEFQQLGRPQQVLQEMCS